MVARILIIASVACVFNLANGISAPFPGFKPCKTSDDACILQVSNAGIKHFAAGLLPFGIKSSDPDHYDRIDASTPNLKFILSDVTLTGLKNCKAIKAKRDEPNLQMTLVLQCDLKLQGNYKMNGKVLILNMEGDGQIRAHLPNIISTVTCHYFYKEGKDGKKHLRIKNFEHTYELKGKSTLELDNLFPENELLRQAAQEVVKNDPHAVIEEIGTKVFQSVVHREVGNMNKLFTVMSYDEVSLD